eukprot:TRINITY_DN120781_c0_g1_i1.p1 TRINITY_DN120781_c0_g1~~TRINITY_DN120781_c0_g1_i1.p1  ORF type:complete len:421 (+),score=114.18 TRINITY_DN120781_c0_g1_i1:48-1265(+)
MSLLVLQRSFLICTLFAAQTYAVRLSPDDDNLTATARQAADAPGNGSQQDGNAVTVALTGGYGGQSPGPGLQLSAIPARRPAGLDPRRSILAELGSVDSDAAELVAEEEEEASLDRMAVALRQQVALHRHRDRAQHEEHHYSGLVGPLLEEASAQAQAQQAGSSSRAGGSPGQNVEDFPELVVEDLPDPVERARRKTERIKQIADEALGATDAEAGLANDSQTNFEATLEAFARGKQTAMKVKEELQEVPEELPDVAELLNVSEDEMAHDAYGRPAGAAAGSKKTGSKGSSSTSAATNSSGGPESAGGANTTNAAGNGTSPAATTNISKTTNGGSAAAAGGSKKPEKNATAGVSRAVTEAKERAEEAKESVRDLWIRLGALGVVLLVLLCVVLGYCCNGRWWHLK